MDAFELDTGSCHLEEAASRGLTPNSSPAEVYDGYEQLAIEILDSEFEQYPEGVLEAFLRGYLQGLSKGLNLTGE